MTSKNKLYTIEWITFPGGTGRAKYDPMYEGLSYSIGL